MPPRLYWTLCVRLDGVWSPEFGDYDREVVDQERVDSWSGLSRDYWRIIRTGAAQREIDAAVQRLNGGAA